MPPGSRQRVDSRCRTVTAPPTLGPAADLFEGGTVPSPSADPAVLVDAPTGSVARRRRVASRARTLQPDRRPPRTAPDPARRGPGRRRPRRQPRHRAPRGRRAAGRVAGEHAARRDPPGRRSSTGRGGRRSVRSALRHRLHRSRFRGRAVATWSTDRTSPDVPGGRRRSRAAGPMPAGRQDHPRHAGAGGGRLRAARSTPARRSRMHTPRRSGRGSPACARPGASSPGAASPSDWVNDPRATSTRARSRACCCCPRWEADERTGRPPGSDRGARARESPGLR